MKFKLKEKLCHLFLRPIENSQPTLYFLRILSLYPNNVLIKYFSYHAFLKPKCMSLPLKERFLD